MHFLSCVATVKECVQNLSQEDDKENLVASLWGAERCLRVLESVSTCQVGCFSYQSHPWLTTENCWMELDSYFYCNLMKGILETLNVTDRRSLLKCHWSEVWTKQKCLPHFQFLDSFWSLSLYLRLLLILFLFHLLPTGDSAEPRKPGLLDCLQRLTTHRLLCQVSTRYSLELLSTGHRLTPRHRPL